MSNRKCLQLMLLLLLLPLLLMFLLQADCGNPLHSGCMYKRASCHVAAMPADSKRCESSVCGECRENGKFSSESGGQHMTV